MTSTLTVNVRDGVKICVPDSLDLITSYVLLEQEDWFEPEIHFVRGLLRPGMRAVNVGANFGVYTMAMANAVGAEGKVWAIEPTPQTAELLQATIDTNRAAHVDLARVAVSDREGTVQFRIADSPELNAIARAGETGSDLTSVPAQTLDDLSARLGWHDVDLVKLDVEEHELQAVNGGHAFFGSASPLLMFEIKSGDAVDLAVLEPLRAMGYLAYRMVPGLSVLVPLLPGQAIDTYQLNAFACKVDRAVKLAEQGLLALPGSSPAIRPPKRAWVDYVQEAPYTRELARRWPSAARLLPAPGLREYLEGLALFAQSRDTRLDGTTRFAALREAGGKVTEAANRKDTLARLLSAARIAWELGQRTSAIDLLAKARVRVAAQHSDLAREPFLSPSPRYDRQAPSASTGEWVACAIDEQLVRLAVFSSYFLAEQQLELVQPMVKIPFRSPEMERRRQLIRIRAGMQAGPEASALLHEPSEENLNPQYWNGPPRTSNPGLR